MALTACGLDEAAFHKWADAIMTYRYRLNRRSASTMRSISR
jgi:hypothetical protein